MSSLVNSVDLNMLMLDAMQQRQRQRQQHLESCIGCFALSRFIARSNCMLLHCNSRTEAGKNMHLPDATS